MEIRPHHHQNREGESVKRLHDARQPVTAELDLDPELQKNLLIDSLISDMEWSRGRLFSPDKKEEIRLRLDASMGENFAEAEQSLVMQSGGDDAA